ncbi:hypothetical protein FK220_015745 [Flavobacteriaceae bacterium TP-CH-4]|uniref:Uncharacterized protein n=1 Tax=Pelagihabitans pacificus TaxID=2696054 RepID=A0A967AX71_9FLAO|nr:hypothetical protein [Pelagihabitans pacificus]NHF60808.1 hypothetical protein [Pelagihabitans pacificus]
MRAQGLSVLIGLVFCIMSHGQVKIGDNPQTIDPASLLELESNTMALVITRVTTPQMEAILPSPGAMVYNTDTQCVYYYDGTQWVNLCEGASINVTTDPIVNSVSTIVLTQTDDGNNIEVAPNSIRSEQIVDGGIFGVDINDNSIGANKLARNSVGKVAMSENAVGPFAIDRDSLPLSFFINDVPFITAADIPGAVSEDPDNAILPDNDGRAFYDDQPLIDAIATNTTAIANDLDGNPENELQNLSLTDNVLTLSNPVGPPDEIDLESFTIGDADATDDIITQFEVVGANLILTEGGIQRQVLLSDLGAGSGTTEVVDGTTLTGDGTAADPFTIEPSPIAGQILTTNAAGDVVWDDLPPGSGGTVTTDGTTIVGDGDTTPLSVVDGGISPIKIEPSPTPNQFLVTNTVGDVEWVSVAPGGGTTELADQVTIVGDGQAGNEFQVADGAIGPIKIEPSATPDQFLTTNAAGDVEWVTVTPGGNPAAADVTFAPTGGTTSDNVQAAIEELQIEIDGISSGGAANPNDELITSFNLTGTELNIAEGANIVPPVDLDLAFATDAELTAAITASNQVIVSTDAPNSITAGVDGGALYNDPDDDATNEIQTDAEVNLAIPVDIDGDLAPETTVQEAINALIATSSDDQTDAEVNLATPVDIDGDLADETTVQEAINALVGIASINVSTDTPNSITTGTDGGALYDDPDDDATNEIQTIASADGSVTVTASGNDYDLSVPGGSTDDQNIEGSILTGETLTIGIEGGNNQDVDLGDFATETELAAAITASEGLDDDTDDTNEIQTITSTDGSVTVTASGNDYDLSVPGGSTDDQNIEGSILTGETLTIGIEGGNNQDVDLGDFATETELAAAITASEGLDDDTDDTNEIQTITSTDGSVTVTASGNDYDLSVPGGSTDDQNIEGSILTGETLTIGIEGGNSQDVDLGDFATETELAAAIAASEGLDDDTDDTNEIQTITSTDGSVTVTASGNDYDLSVPGGSTDDQNIEGSILTGETLTIGIEGGNNQDVDLGDFATETELAAAIAASEGLDDDTDDTNEIQTITSTDGSVTVTATGNDFDLSVSSSITGTTGSLFFADGSGVPTDNNTELFWNASNNRLGIGTNNPQRKLDVSGEVRSQGYANSNGTVDEPSYAFTNDSDTGMWRGGNTDFLRFSTGSVEALTINPSQNVGIGINTPSERLDVLGNIRASGDFISGAITLDVPDYVFEKYFDGYSDIDNSYQFKTLEEIEAFVRTNKHLPGIRSAAEAKKTGIWNLSESNLKNLEKIEELFLHTIEQQKQIEGLQSQNVELKNEVNMLQKRLASIEALLSSKENE